ncbi:MAG TPA: fumarylacetoacetate hydrolase family protein [Candidatus Micrarchaeia archaeon]|nr:fumarylacetoacetate hydrolase family protein [Candidatus Micrarchaeia archaeon]
MRLVTFRDRGVVGAGAVEGDRVVALAPAYQAWLSRSGQGRAAERAAALLPPSAGELLAGGAASLDAARAAVAHAMTGGDRDGDPDLAPLTLPFDRVELLPPVLLPPKIICVGVNYADHAAESAGTFRAAPYPVLFARFAASLVGHRSPILKPAISDELDWEGELAVVIGRAGHRVARADALGLVGGYSCFNDATLRDFQRHSSQWTPGKNFAATGGFGPWIVLADAVGSPAGLDLTVTVNGERMQHASTADMTFDIPRLIEYITSFTPLGPGDVIATGTPSGVGAFRTPPRFLRPGDVVAVEISKVGRLENPVQGEDSA